ncbi:uncharacterized protein LOC143234738 [Tachypleus tridentatus]|uniref:uncharacterized protein LOC143234738 n=1 Tax=Tachypleus tridentatus TaxID=6853 RepID=UPI003FD54D15
MQMTKRNGFDVQFQRKRPTAVINIVCLREMSLVRRHSRFLPHPNFRHWIYRALAWPCFPRDAFVSLSFLTSHFHNAPPHLKQVKSNYKKIKLSSMSKDKEKPPLPSSFRFLSSRNEQCAAASIV